MINLVAWQLQNIGKPSRVIPTLISVQQQVGKSLFLDILSAIFGPSGRMAATTDQVLGRFNDIIRGAVYVRMEEVLFSGDKRSADLLKNLSTQTIVSIEGKNLPIVQCPVGVNIWIASNHENAAHIEEADDRYWVLKVSPHRHGDHEYFAELVREMEDGGIAAFADYVLNLDVSAFTPWRDVPKKNAAKQAMIRASINPYDARKWLEASAQAGRLLGLFSAPHGQEGSWHYSDNSSGGGCVWNAGDCYRLEELMKAYSDWQKSVKSPVAAVPTPVGSLGAVFSTSGFKKARPRLNGEKTRLFKLPSTEDCLLKLGIAPEAENDEGIELIN